MIEISINSGAKDCITLENIHEITCEMKDFYKVKSEVEKKISNFLYSGIEWRPYNYLTLTDEQKQKVLAMLESLDDVEDIQNIFINCKF